MLAVDNLRYRLMPYIYSLAWKVTSAGYTMMRPLVFDFQNDTMVYGIKDQFMFGPALLVSPVTAMGATSRSVYLPAGTWYDFWTGSTTAGGATTTASAPLSQIPIYVRGGSIVPMGPMIQYATQSIDPLEIRVYAGADASFTIYEDEGDTYNYEMGQYAQIPLTWNNASQDADDRRAHRQLHRHAGDANVQRRVRRRESRQRPRRHRRRPTRWSVTTARRRS